MLSRSLLFLVSALAVASAGPIVKRCNNTSTTTEPTATTAVTPTLPITGGATELPAANGTLKQILVGHGIQNYTCSAAGVNGTSAGALAVLYDITSIYNSLSEAQANNLSSAVLETTDMPLNLAADNGPNQYAADVNHPFKDTDADITVSGISQPLKAFAHHYFDTALVPTFDVFGAGELFKGGKLNNVKAPAAADPGPLKTGAVDWLRLGDKGASVGLLQVYRVVTAGGNPLVCDSAGQTFSVPYAAQYWFYD